MSTPDNTAKRFGINGDIFSLQEIADANPDDPEVVEIIDTLEIGETWDDQHSEPVIRLPDSEYTPDGITLTLSVEQIATLTHALGIASDEFAKLAARCYEMGNTRHTQDTALRDIGNIHTHRACDLVDLMMVLRAATT